MQPNDLIQAYLEPCGEPLASVIMSVCLVL